MSLNIPNSTVSLIFVIIINFYIRCVMLSKKEYRISLIVDLPTPESPAIANKIGFDLTL